MFDQLKAAQGLLKNMNPGDLKELVGQAKEAQQMMAQEIKKAVEEEIRRRDLISRDEVLRLIKENK
ncbi:MAG TPA: hypothetical protein VMU70_01735 [Candidatus Tyrphobacter sp.]|nr:hypothetical protein [Candidatus Tyrphobacter sp.]